MKKLLPLLYGWMAAALAGGILLSVLFWIQDAAASTHSTYYPANILYRIFLMSFWVGVIMTPGVVIAAIIRFLKPDFRGPRSLLSACGVGLVTILGFIIFTNTSVKDDFPIIVSLSMSAVFVASLFWWISLKTTRVEQGSDGKPDTVVS